MKHVWRFFGNWRAAAAASAVIGVMAFAAVLACEYLNAPAPARDYAYEDTRYGAFLAAQHAIHANDFESAARFARFLDGENAALAKNTGILAEFLNGEIGGSAAALEKESGMQHKMIYTSWLLSQDGWPKIYSLWKGSDSMFLAPIRIWSGVAAGKVADAMRFIDSVNTASDGWRDWTKGMIYAETGRPDKAKAMFDKVGPDFMNLNDYMYLSAFYDANGFSDAAAALRRKFTDRPSGLYMLNRAANADWAGYSGPKNALRFSLLQSVSHSVPLSQSDLGILMLRMSQLASGDREDDAVNYYLGNYFHAKGGDYEKYFSRIGRDSLFEPFVLLKYAEKAGDSDEQVRELAGAVQKNPLFVPAIVKLVAINVQNGRENDALRVLDDALVQPNLSDAGRAFLLKSRARVRLMFGSAEAAQNDIALAAQMLPMDAGVMSEQARIWTAQGRNLNEAYAYSLALVKKFPSEIEIWDTLGLVVWAKEGAAAALPIYEKVGRVAETCSSLFEHLGDIYAELGDGHGARAAYSTAIGLSGDGMTVESVLRDKLKALK